MKYRDANKKKIRDIGEKPDISDLLEMENQGTHGTNAVSND